MNFSRQYFWCCGWKWWCEWRDETNICVLRGRMEILCASPIINTISLWVWDLPLVCRAKKNISKIKKFRFCFFNFHRILYSFLLLLSSAHLGNLFHYFHINRMWDSFTWGGVQCSFKLHNTTHRFIFGSNIKAIKK